MRGVGLAFAPVGGSGAARFQKRPAHRSSGRALRDLLPLDAVQCPHDLETHGAEPVRQLLREIGTRCLTDGVDAYNGFAHRLLTGL